MSFVRSIYVLCLRGNKHSALQIPHKYVKPFQCLISGVTHFTPRSISIPLKTSENLWFSEVLMGYRNGTFSRNEFKDSSLNEY